MMLYCGYVARLVCHHCNQLNFIRADIKIDTLEATLDSTERIPIGLPKIPDAGSELHLSVMRAWLADCDAHKCVPSDVERYCPLRLLYLGSDAESRCCRLIETSKLADQGKHVRYIALSHPWGDPEDCEPFKTTQDNIGEHMENIDEEELPQNFRDAIEVTRGLGQSYLWIDSICIRQRSEGDEGDFHAEAEHMQGIFSSAYCVIAASSATNMDDGFLDNRELQTIVTWSPRNSKGDKSNQFHISRVVDDFDHDVGESHLSRRGWVLQERALARRTLYFTNNQAYFECGVGIRCETLSKLKRSACTPP